MTPLRITARLVNGYAMRDPWSPALDGILAAVVMRERLGAEAYAIASASPRDWTPVEGLPLAVERDGGHWWYAASCPRAVDAAGRERRHFHRRFDDQHERHMVDGIRKVMTSAGPYKGTRLADTRVICRGLEWHVIGEQPELERLLQHVTQIGARRSIGYGEVSAWRVEAGDADIARLQRPLPAGYAARLGITGLVLPRGLVPPSRCNLVECVMPVVSSHA